MTTKLLAITVLTISFNLKLPAQKEIDVTDQTIKIGGFREEELLFGFAEGDKILFNFQEKDDNTLKEVEILEYPSNSKFSDFKTSKIENKTFNVIKTGVFIFRFKNGALKGRVCRIKIQRIPQHEKYRNFNTSVTWADQQDTTYQSYTKEVVAGYDTTYKQQVKRVLIKTETKEEMIMDKNERVHSRSNEHSNTTHLFFTLPKNETLPYKTRKVVAWAYWIGVDDAGNKAWQQNSNTISKLVKGAAAIYLTPLGALAAGAVTSLMLPSAGEDVEYWLMDTQNKDLFYSEYQYSTYDKGKGIAGYRKFTQNDVLQGTYFIVLRNDNYMQGINANVKVTVIMETNLYEDKPYTETVITPRYEKKIFKDPIITIKRVPITGQ